MANVAILISGLGFGLSLIVAIGAQNAFVLRRGLLRQHVLPVVAICAASDVVLISAGVGGVAVVLQRVPTLVAVVRIAGAVFLAGYGLLAARRALQPSALVAEADVKQTSLAGASTSALALTWLNPHVYLDTVVLLGAVSNSHGNGRAWFGAGAMLASFIWFFALGYGARSLRTIFARPAAWRVLDATVASVMLVLALSLIVEGFGA